MTSRGAFLAALVLASVVLCPAQTGTLTLAGAGLAAIACVAGYE